MNTRSNLLTVMFADICNSVRMYEKVGDAKGMDIAERSMQLMKIATEAHGGEVVRPQGDGVKSTFPSVDAAFDAARRMQSLHSGTQCTIKIAFSHGEIIHAQDDVFGDPVHLAARLLSLARSGEILMPGDTAAGLSAERRRDTRLLDTTRLKGKSHLTEVFYVAGQEHEQETDVTMIASQLWSQNEANSRLVLRQSDNEFGYENHGTPLVIGRATDCDLVINSSFASRHHAQIELKRNYFVLTDQSMNGTYVANEGSEPVFLKRESVQLVGNGSISLGRPIEEAADELISFFQDRLTD